MTGPRPVVLDASVAIAIIRREAAAHAARATVAQWISVGRPLVVPSHFWLEVANVLFRRHRWNGEEVLTAIHDLEELGLETVEPGPGARLLMIDAAERFGLSSYDAQYIAVAEELDGDLATFDAALAAAAGPRSIAIGPAGRVSEFGPVDERTATWPRYTAVSAYLAALRERETREARHPEAVTP